MPTIFSLLSNQVLKMGKAFVIDGSYVTLYEFLSAGFLLGGSNRTQSHNHLVRKQTLNHYAKLFVCRQMQKLDAV